MFPPIVLCGGIIKKMNKLQIVNIVIRPSKIWTTGNIRINGGTVNKIDSKNHNFIEMQPYNFVRYQQPTTTTLFVNNMIVYQQPKLFSYYIELNLDVNINNFQQKDLYDTITYDTVDCD
jgi:hypothetical protein